MATELHQLTVNAISDASRTDAALIGPMVDQIVAASQRIASALKSGRKVLLFGNGGSASQSSHLAAEFVGRFQHDRPSLPALALNDNTAAVTAIGNDYAFHEIFARQIAGLGQTGDIAIGLSTSGTSPNILEACRRAKAKGLVVIGLTGSSGGELAALCDICCCVPSASTARIQEAHLLIGHILCQLVDVQLGVNT